MNRCSANKMVPGGEGGGEGQKNDHEYIAGMRADDPESLFCVRSTSNSTTEAGFVLNWDSVAGRVYGVHWASNLASVFSPLETNIHYPQHSYTDTLHQAEDAGYYRIDVRLE